MKGVFCGSGAHAMASRKVCDAILDLTSKSPSEVTVLYLGTPSYDSNEMKVLQTSRLLEAGCTILEIQCANECLDSKSHEGKFMQADVVLISGGNALYAMDVWKALGMDRMLVRAARRGVVCAGGSAGAICWFDGGCSDSANPLTFRNPDNRHMNTPWDLMRVQGLGLLPGIICPHANAIIESTELSRLEHFKELMSCCAGDRGLSMNPSDVLVVDGPDYTTFSSIERSNTTDSGTSMCAVELIGRDVVVTPIPPKGRLVDMLRPAKGAEVVDPRVPECRLLNPVPFNVYAVEVRHPFSQLILRRIKTMETRTYDLPSCLRGKCVYLLEPPSTTASSTSSADSRMNSSVYSDDVLSTKSLLGDRVTFDLEKTRSSDCKVIGYVVFDASKRYKSLEEWDADRSLHRVPEGSPFDWTPSSGRHVYGWKIGGAGDLDGGEGWLTQQVITLNRVYRSIFSIVQQQKG